MRTIRLETRDCHFVAETVIPKFNPMPDVIVWGERVFQASPEDGVYREAFAFVVPIVHESAESAR